jgi:hypothetical protein
MSAARAGPPTWPKPVVETDLGLGDGGADPQAGGIRSGPIPVAKPDVVQLCLGRPFAGQAEFGTKADHPTPNSLRRIAAGGEHVVRIETTRGGHNTKGGRNIQVVGPENAGDADVLARYGPAALHVKQCAVRPRQRRAESHSGGGLTSDGQLGSRITGWVFFKGSELSERWFVMRTLLRWLWPRPRLSLTLSPNGTPRATNKKQTLPKSQRLRPRTTSLRSGKVITTVSGTPPSLGQAADDTKGTQPLK